MKGWRALAWTGIGLFPVMLVTAFIYYGAIYGFETLIPYCLIFSVLSALGGAMYLDLSRSRR